MNVFEKLGYKTGSAISTAIKKCGDESLLVFKPYDKMSDDNVKILLSAIKEHLPKTKHEMVESILDSFSADSVLERSESEAFKMTGKKNNSNEILQGIVSSLEEIPRQNQSKHGTIFISEMLEKIGVRSGSDYWSKIFYRINNSVGREVPYPNEKSKDYFKEKIFYVTQCIINSDYAYMNLISIEQAIFILENPYMIIYNDRIHLTAKTSLGQNNIFGINYSFVSLEKMQNYLQELKKIVDKQ
jgi:hypothetical protein